MIAVPLLPQLLAKEGVFTLSVKRCGPREDVARRLLFRLGCSWVLLLYGVWNEKAPVRGAPRPLLRCCRVLRRVVPFRLRVHPHIVLVVDRMATTADEQSPGSVARRRQ